MENGTIAPTAAHGWTVTKMHDDLTVDLHQCRTCGHYKALNGYTKEKACNCLLETGHRRKMDEEKAQKKKSNLGDFIFYS